MARAYGTTDISERHRNKFGINRDYMERLDKGGMNISGINANDDTIEIVEIPSKDYFVGVLFHAEFKSRPQRPHPLYNELIKAAIK